MQDHLKHEIAQRSDRKSFSFQKLNGRTTAEVFALHEQYMTRVRELEVFQEKLEKLKFRENAEPNSHDPIEIASLEAYLLEVEES